MTPEEIASLYRARKERLATRHARMREVSDVYNGRVELPLPELSKFERASVPNLCQQGTDQLARRIASVLPNQIWPALRPGIQKSEDLADKRRQIAYGWLEHSHPRKLFSRRARWFVTYASAPAIVRPDAKLSMPVWEPYSPLDTFPSPGHIDSYTPDDVILRHKRTLGWIKARYPDAAAKVDKPRECTPDEEFEVLEYIGADEIKFCVMGKADPQAVWGGNNEPNTVEMVSLPNRAGICTAVIPERVSLDAPTGQFDGILGMYATQAALMALSVIATRRAIWPHTWLVNPNTGAHPHIVQQPDAETGTPGIVVNGIIDRQQLDPSFRADQVIDRLEFAQRQTAGLPQELGGTGSENVRTGRRGNQIMSASIDFTIAEAQDALAEALHEENKRAVEIDRAYFPKSKSIYVSTKGVRGKVDYKASEVWEDGAEHIVEYPIAGTDLSDLVINGGQRVGMGTMSKRSFMDIDPLVSDAEAEENRVRMEQVEQGFFVGWQAKLADPAGPWRDEHAAEFAERLARGEKWYQIVKDINKELQEKQAEGAEGAETMPGLAPQGAPGEIPSINEPGPSMGNLTQILNQLGSADTALAVR